MDFVAVEVEAGEYGFFPTPHSVPSGSNQRAGLSQDEKVMSEPIPLTKRIFLHNHLHDYESIWWVAIWFVFYCEPEGVAQGMMEKARKKVYSNRSRTLHAGAINHACELLPVVLQPLGKVLVEIKDALVKAYRSFEESFDGPGMLVVFKELRKHFLVLEEQAKGLAPPKLPIKSRTLGPTGVQQSNAAHEEGQGGRGREVAERCGGTGDQPADVDNPFISSRAGGSVLGKRRGREESPPSD